MFYVRYNANNLQKIKSIKQIELLPFLQLFFYYFFKTQNFFFKTKQNNLINKNNLKEETLSTKIHFNQNYFKQLLNIETGCRLSTGSVKIW
jgi:hypothetical protein